MSDVSADYDPATHTFWTSCSACGAIETLLVTVAAAHAWQTTHQCAKENG